MIIRYPEGRALSGRPLLAHNTDRRVAAACHHPNIQLGDGAAAGLLEKETVAMHESCTTEPAISMRVPNPAAVTQVFLHSSPRRVEGCSVKIRLISTLPIISLWLRYAVAKTEAARHNAQQCFARTRG